MCSKRLCDSERNAGASRPFKTEPRSSGRSFVILGGSVKLDAVILISHNLIEILCGSGKVLVGDRIRRNSRLNDVHRKTLWWRFTLKWVSGKLGLRNQSRGCQSRFLPKTTSSAINSQYLDENSSRMTLVRFGGVTICVLVCDAFDTILGRQTHFMILCDAFCLQMCSKRLCDSERNAGASRPFKTEPRSSGRSFVILGGSLKLDAVILISHKSFFGHALCKAL
ncbi:hypothetical protein MRB53_023507 [Persea americana]|uniref:Uncharacterized protein n=3 Tax=Persea americana TaxID=3435 RepID=A0ACC2LAK1_PERAE|nr:hypothetical protein MRB53_023505 [Persea americana]KAJ8630183.1 hypothetical protein MRB53_023506 [Persea americana]KAJ8630184.1 hypothetical protein MRB53_023507 [Persea americana]